MLAKSAEDDARTAELLQKQAQALGLTLWRMQRDADDERDPA